MPCCTHGCRSRCCRRCRCRVPRALIACSSSRGGCCSSQRRAAAAELWAGCRFSFSCLTLRNAAPKPAAEVVPGAARGFGCFGRCRCDVFCLQRAHSLCMNLCGSTSDLSWRVSGGQGLQPPPPIAAAAFPGRQGPTVPVARAWSCARCALRGSAALGSPWQRGGDAGGAGHRLSPPQLPCVSVTTCPPVLVIPNLISTDFIFTSRLWMKMLNIIIR